MRTLQRKLTKFPSVKEQKPLEESSEHSLHSRIPFNNRDLVPVFDRRPPLEDSGATLAQINMLNALPRNSLKVFGDGPINSMKTTFLRARRRLSLKLQNPRLLQIHFHTFRHWQATMEYH